MAPSSRSCGASETRGKHIFSFLFLFQASLPVAVSPATERQQFFDQRQQQDTTRIQEEAARDLRQEQGFLDFKASLWMSRRF